MSCPQQHYSGAPGERGVAVRPVEAEPNSLLASGDRTGFPGTDVSSSGEYGRYWEDVWPG